MTLNLTMMSISSVLVVSSLLIIYSILDVRERRVKNEIIFLGGAAGCVVLILTEHFAYNAVLHITALLLVIPISYALFRIGSLGGADVKGLLTVALLSPGVELGDWNQPVLEAIGGLGGLLLAMLLGGYLFWRYKNRESSPPLIPFLLIGYLMVQLLALF